MSIEYVEPLLPAGVRRKHKKRLSPGSELPRSLRGSELARLLKRFLPSHGCTSHDARHRDAPRCNAIVCACFGPQPSSLSCASARRERERDERERERTTGNYRFYLEEADGRGWDASPVGMRDGREEGRDARREGVYTGRQTGKVEDRCTDRALNPLCSKQQVRCTRTAICKSP